MARSLWFTRTIWEWRPPPDKELLLRYPPNDIDTGYHVTDFFFRNHDCRHRESTDSTGYSCQKYPHFREKQRKNYLFHLSWFRLSLYSMTISWPGSELCFMRNSTFSSLVIAPSLCNLLVSQAQVSALTPWYHHLRVFFVHCHGSLHLQDSLGPTTSYCL